MSFDPRLREADRVNDILCAINEIEGFVAELSRDRFAADNKSVSAVAYQLIIIGEAVNRLSAEVRDRHPEIPWRRIIGMRNMLAHEYGNIVPRIVWDVAASQLAPLRAVMITERDWLASL